MSQDPGPQAVALELERGFAAGRDALTPLIDVAALMRADLTHEVSHAAQTGLEVVVARVGGSLLATVQAGGRLKSLGVKTIEGREALVLRLRVPSGGFNYLALAISDSGRVVDWYPFDLGEWFSEGQRRLTPLAPGGGAEMTSLQQQVTLASQVLQSMNESVAVGRWSTVLTGYYSLPPELQNDRACLRMRVIAASHIDADSYRAALEAFLARFAGEPGADLLAIDGYLALDKPEESLAAIDRLQALVGDPLLGLLRAGVLEKWGQPVEAREALTAVVKSLPEDQETWWALVSLGLTNRDNASVSACLTALGKLGVRFGDVTKAKEYRGFVESAEGKAWLSKPASST